MELVILRTEDNICIVKDNVTPNIGLSVYLLVATGALKYMQNIMLLHYEYSRTVLGE